MAVPPATLLGSGRDFSTSCIRIQFRAASDWFVSHRTLATIFVVAPSFLQGRRHNGSHEHGLPTRRV